MVDNFSDILTNSQNKTKMNRSGISLNSEQKMRLIEAIHERPQIWDNSYEGFRSNPTRQGAFNEVAELLSIGGPEVFTRVQIQEEWGKLRYCFTRIVKKLYDEGYINQNGTIIQQNQDHQLITWPYWQPMNFLLEGVALQLCSTRGGGGNNIGDDGTGSIIGDSDGHNKGSSRHNSEEKEHHKVRRGRKNMRGILTTTAATHKNTNKGGNNNNSYLAIEEDLACNKSQSTNDLLMSNLLSFAPQDLLFSNLNALNEHFHQPHKIEDDDDDIETIIINSNSNINNNINLNNKLEDEEKNNKNNNINNIMEYRRQQQQNNDVGKFVGNGNNTNIRDDGEVVVNENLRNKRKRKKEDVLASSLNDLNNLLQSRIEATGQNGQQNDHQQEQSRTYSPAPLEPSTTTKNKLNYSINGSEGATICSASNSILNGNYGVNGGGGTIDDVNESFGRCIVNQLQMVAKKDKLLCVQMRKKLLEVCFEYEMEACKISNNKTDE